MVVNKVNFHMSMKFLPQTPTCASEKYTCITKIAWNCYPKRGPRGPRRLVKKYPFPVFFVLSDDNMFN